MKSVELGSSFEQENTSIVEKKESAGESTEKRKQRYHCKYINTDYIH